MKTTFAKKDEFKRDWFLVDASEKILGKMASNIAIRLRGKNKPIFTPNADTGDFVIVVNAEKIQVTGDKLEKKFYHSHSGFPGGLKTESLRHRMQRKPEDIIKKAVWGMLPKNRLGRAMLKKLKVYKGPEHPHAAQQPSALNI